ncbi:MAG: hypothetical protein A2033_06630 [Bacteroidetes bacterium GWA2_31_9]|nr:MAG: hypothetical protein A2033_06630 [Bacteroidetes bacterium GWA2_31_9]
MNWFNNLTITKKLLVSFSIVGIISISINSYIFIRISTAHNKSDKILNKWLPGLININDIYNIISNLKVNENKLVYKSLSNENYSNELDQIHKDLNQLNKNELAYLSIERDTSELKLFKEYKTIYDNYVDYLNKYIINSKIKDVYKNSITFYFEKFNECHHKLIVLGKEKIENENILAKQYLKDELIKLIIIFIFSIILILLVTILISRQISVPLIKLETKAALILQGNIDFDIEINSKDEIGLLARTFNKMSISIKDMMQSLRDNNLILEQKVKDRTIELEDYVNKLKQSEERLRVIFNSGNDAIFISELKESGFGNFTDVNDIACKRLGYTRDELLKLTAGDINSQEVLPEVALKFQQIKKSETLISESVHITNEGKEIPVEINASVFKWNGKKYVLAVARDISERKHNAERLNKLSRALEQTPASVVITNINGEIEYVNSTFSKVTGFAYEEAIGQNPRILKSDVHPSDFYLNMWNKVLAENIWSGEMCNKKKNGDLYWESVTMSPLRNEKGNVINYIAVKEDITKRKQIELELNKLNKAIEESHVSVIITDFNGNIEYVNPFFLNFTGYNIEEVIGQNPRIINSGFHSKTFFKDLWDTITSGQVWHGEFCNMTKNKEFFWENATISPIKNDKNEITHFVSIQGNITALKHAEKELVTAKEDADVANKTKSEFLANMSHEIRTPMNSIMGFSDLLHSSVKDPKQLSHVESIRTSCKNLLIIINDILDLSKIEAGKLNFQYEAINLFNLIKDIENMFINNINSKGLMFEITNIETIPQFLIIDETRVRQVLFNLIGNAVKFTDKGKISLNFRKIIKKSNNFIDLIISVKDTGIGIPKEQLKVIFEAFSQNKSQNTKKYGGTGLGLTITKRLVEMMNGEITVCSEINEGSTFEVILKDIEIAEEEAQNILENPIDFSISIFDKAKVLIVDDDQSNRELLFEILSDSKLTMIEATNGLEAVDSAIKNPPDIILMDLSMPEMDGYKAAKLIKNNESTKNVPIVLITAFNLSNQMDDVQLSIFDDILNKPFNMIDFFRILKKYLKYTENETSIKTNENEDFSDNFLNYINSKTINPELLNILENEILPDYNKTINNQMIDQIELLGKRLIEIGETYNFNYISNLGNDICFYANNFEIEKLSETLKNIPEFINKIKSKEIENEII